VIGHDRGARVGYRLALDHPDRLERLVLLDIVPTSEFWAAQAEKPPRVWQRTFAPHIQDALVDSGHFIPEEAPQATLGALASFFRHG
jgi:pimeloyl-ACP methyl ester carboxylesterase